MADAEDVVRRLDEMLTRQVDGWPRAYNMDPVVMAERMILAGQVAERTLFALQVHYGLIELPQPPEGT